MKHAFTLIFALSFALMSRAQSLYFPPLTGNTWETTDPATLNWCPEKIDSLIAFLDANHSKAFLVLKDGSTLSRHVEYSRGMPENPMAHAEVERKFLSVAGAAVGHQQAAAILTLANGLFAARSVAPLNQLLATCTVAELRERSH